MTRDWPPFQPHPLARGGHLQTLAAHHFQRRLDGRAHRRHVVQLADGDAVVLHDDQPESWRPGDRVALMLHGLAGCYLSPYMIRIGRKLRARGVRTVRMDLRSAGAGITMAKRPYHAGRSEDVLAALSFLGLECPGSPVALIGFSLGGNIALKLVGEAGAEPPVNLDRVMAVCPPIDLEMCVRSFTTTFLRTYDRYFTRLVWEHLNNWWSQVPDAPRTSVGRRPRNMYELDSAVTAPISGFASAEDYYTRCSAVGLLPRVQVPTLIVAAADDPLVPVRPIVEAPRSSAVATLVTPSGGHLGYIGRRNGDPDGRWIDWRIVDWAIAKP